MGEAEGKALNTDDHPILEFGFARNLGRFGLFRLDDLYALVKARGEDRPATRGTPLDPARVAEMRVARAAYWEVPLADPDPKGDRNGRLRVAARHAWVRRALPAACAAWFAQPEPPGTHADRLLVAECLAAARDPRTPAAAAALAQDQPIETDLVLAQWLAATGRPAEAGERLLAALTAYRKDPWVYRPLMGRSLPLAADLGRSDRALAARLYEALGQPFAAHMYEQQRLLSRIWLARDDRPGPPRAPRRSLPWSRTSPGRSPFLEYRWECYRRTGSPLAARARRDLGGIPGRRAARSWRRGWRRKAPHHPGPLLPSHSPRPGE